MIHMLKATNHVEVTALCGVVLRHGKDIPKGASIGGYATISHTRVTCPDCRAQPGVSGPGTATVEFWPILSPAEVEAGLVRCDHCGQGFDRAEHERCPWCAEPGVSPPVQH